METQQTLAINAHDKGTQSFNADDFRFRKEESYLVYAYGQEGKLWTNACTRTKRLADAEEDLLELGEGKVPEKKGSASSIMAKPNKRWKRTLH